MQIVGCVGVANKMVSKFVATGCRNKDLAGKPLFPHADGGGVVDHKGQEKGAIQPSGFECVGGSPLHCGWLMLCNVAHIQLAVPSSLATLAGRHGGVPCAMCHVPLLRCARVSSCRLVSLKRACGEAFELAIRTL